MNEWTEPNILEEVIVRESDNKTWPYNSPSFRGLDQPQKVYDGLLLHIIAMLIVNQPKVLNKQIANYLWYFLTMQLPL